MCEEIVVNEPDLTTFEVWLASNPDELAVRRWFMAIEAYYMRQALAEQPAERKE